MAVTTSDSADQDVSRPSAHLRRSLIRELAGDGTLHTEAIARAFGAVERERFVPGFAAEEGLEAVYRDEVIVAKRSPTGATLATSSQPRVMALMLELLAAQPGERILEIGTGTGYHAALLAELVGPTGRVVSVEVDPELAATAASVLGDRVEVVAADGRQGWAAGGPYDAIIATAGADTVPRPWFEQVRPGGRLVVPLRFDAGLPPAQAVVAFTRDFAGFTSYAATAAYFLPLRADGEPDGSAAVPALVAHDGLGPAELVRITGPALHALAEPARRELLATALGAPGARRVSAPRPFEVASQLALVLPGERAVVVTRAGAASGVGAVGRDGESLAVVTPVPNGLRLERFGRADAEARLLQVEIERFATHAPPHGLAIAVGAQLAGAPGHHRRRYEREGVVLTIDPSR